MCVILNILGMKTSDTVSVDAKTLYYDSVSVENKIKNFNSLEVVSRFCDPQLQVCENYVF